MRFSLKGRGVVITGASGGIGGALALECARRGAKLALVSRDLKATRAVAAQCLKLGAPVAIALKADLTKAARAKDAARRAELEFGGVDVLVNNAGVHLFAKVEDLPEAEFLKAFSTNVLGPLRMTQALLPGMKKRGEGLIVMVGSTLGWRAIPNAGGYCATKGALARLTESLRVETLHSGVRVLQFDPGVVTSRLRDRAFSKGVEIQPQAKLPFPRSAEATAQDLADAMESGRRDRMSAAWPVRFSMKFVNWIAPGLVDRGMAGRAH